MQEINQTEFKGWARVEVMGHQTHIGYVETQAFGATVLFRVDRPEIPEEEITLTTREWIGSRYAPAGSILKRAKIEATSVLIGAGSIYRIIPCDENIALVAIRESERRALLIVRLADDQHALTGEAWHDPDEDKSDEDEAEDPVHA